jgi:pilus assembly protein FimV
MYLLLDNGWLECSLPGAPVAASGSAAYTASGSMPGRRRAMLTAGIPALARRLARGLVLLGALLAATTASALSVGDIELQSRVGEPLRAVVPLGNLGSLSQDDILAGRAPEETYRTYGVDRAFYTSPLRFEVRVDAKGNASVLVTTEQPVSEPFIDLVMEVRWPAGRAVKQFTLLLDIPPE